MNFTVAWIPGIRKSRPKTRSEKPRPLFGADLKHIPGDECNNGGFLVTDVRRNIPVKRYIYWYRIEFGVIMKGKKKKNRDE